MKTAVVRDAGSENYLGSWTGGRLWLGYGYELGLSTSGLGAILCVRRVGARLRRSCGLGVWRLD